jgi:flagellar hook protein FlgE
LPIQLPESITLPALPTQNVSLSTNLNNDTHITTSTPVTGTIDFSAMYNKDGDDMQIRDKEDLFFGFGHTVTYNNGLLSSTYCLEDDKKDGIPVDIDFSLNSKEIKLTLPDGSTKEDIANAIANALQKEGFNASSNQGEVTINTTDKFILTSNTPLLQNSAAAVMTYKETPTDEFDFSTMNDFISLLQKLSSTAYPNQVNVSLQDGSVVVQNDSNELLNSFISKASNSNEMFLQNLGNLGEEIFPKSQNKSLKFLSNSQQFGGYVIDAQGNKDPISFNFTKQKVTPTNQVWQGEITISTPNGDIKTAQNFTFDTNGNLIEPKEINFDNINFNFSLTAFSKANNTKNFEFTQDGIEEGYLTNYQIDENGNILGLFSNSQQIKLAQIPIFHFQNPQGLESIGDSRFMQTPNSGEAFLYTDENGNYIPTKILSNKIEESNVNLSQAMTELIVTQKAFQASAKTVTTSDEMIQKAINLKR